MLSLNKFKQIVENEKVTYTETELKELVEYLSGLAEIEISIRKEYDEKH